MTAAVAWVLVHERCGCMNAAVLQAEVVQVGSAVQGTGQGIQQGIQQGMGTWTGVGGPGEGV